MNIKRILGNLWFWLGAGLLLVVATLAIQNLSRQAGIVPNTGAGASSVSAQSVPEAGVQGVSNYINAHSGPSSQKVPEAGAQGVTNYINAHGNSSDQAAPDPAVQSVMDYLKAHGIDIE